MTGPKISFWMISSSCCRPETTVGSKKKPSVADAGDRRRRPRRGRAARSKNADHPVELVGVVDRRRTARPRRRAVRSWSLSLRLLGERGDEVVVDAGRGEHPGRRGAVLAGVEVAGDGDALGGGLEVGVVEHDDRRLAAELEVHALDVAWPPTPATSMPARTEPVIDTICGVGCSTSARPVSRSPQMTLKTPGGRNSAVDARPSAAVETGVVSDGLSTTVLPAAMRRRELPDRHHHRVVPRRDLGARRRSARAGSNDVWPAMYSPADAALEHARGAGEEPDLVDHRRDLLRRASARAACRCSRDSSVDELVGVRLDRRRRCASSAFCRSRGRGVAPGLERRRPPRVARGRRPAADGDRRVREHLAGASGRPGPMVRPSAASTGSPSTKLRSVALVAHADLLHGGSSVAAAHDSCTTAQPSPGLHGYRQCEGPVSRRNQQ